LLASLSAILRSDGEAGEEGGRSRGEGSQHTGHDERRIRHRRQYEGWR
jgi:hypothetical protein